MDNLLLDFSDVQIQPKVGFAQIALKNTPVEPEGDR